jgi:hypothetical protein
VTSALLELFQQFRQYFGFGHDQHVVHDVSDLGAGDARGYGLPEIDQPQPHPPNQLFVIENSDYVLGTALGVVHRNARVLPFDHAI